jgi:lysophospholipase L1-like esterase
MNKLILFGLFITAMFLMSINDAKKQKIIFFGDSITEAGAKAGGYIRLMESMLAKDGIADQFELIGSGIGGNKITDLYLRLENDVLSKSPDVVVIYIGINDVWHKKSAGTGTDLWKFEGFYDAIVKKIQASGAKVVICTPTVIGERTDYSNDLDGELNMFSNTIRTFAKKNNLPLVDLRNAFLNYTLQHNPNNEEKGILTSDRVHLNAAGNQLVAEEMWTVLKKIK